MQKAKKSISIVKEEDESKEVSRLEDDNTQKREESKIMWVSDNSSSSSGPDLDDDAFLKQIQKHQKDNYSNISMVKQSNSRIEEEYEFLANLGEGGYGKVLKVKTKSTNQIRAWKVQQKAKFKPSTIQMIRNEIEILKITDHPNIVKVYEFTEDDDNFNIVMEYCQGGELFEYIVKKGTFTEGMAWKIIKQVLSAISYLHSHNIIHSDLKAENIMFVDEDSEDMHVKIIDFGMATKFNPDEKLSRIQGTPYYIAPEVLKGEYDAKADVWSWGILLYIMLSGTPPFKAKSIKEVFKQILKHDFNFDSKRWDGKSDLVKDFIKQLLSFDPNDRPTAQECLKMKWIRRFSKNKACGTNVISKTVLRNLKQFNWERKMEYAIVSYIANFLTTSQNK